MSTPPFSDLYQDVYFSAAGGFAEKHYVFVDGTSLLDHMSKKHDTTVFEAGFGSGLSFLAALKTCLLKAPSGHRLHFHSAEKHPMTADMARAALTPFQDQIGPDLVQSLLQNWPPSIPGIYHLSFENRVFLTVHIGDINDILPALDIGVDAWFLDGFSPRKNPGMWTDTLFSAMRRLSMPGATAATYSAARAIRDGLESALFSVQKIKGFGYKSDMLTARYQGPGYANGYDIARQKRVLIYGGGLASAATAYMLRLYGHIPFVIAPHGLGDAASGNPRGLFNPKITGAIDGIHSLFYNGAYAQFIHFLGIVHPEDIALMPSGALHLAADADTLSKMDQMAKSLGWESYAQVMSRSEAQDCAGIPVNSGGLFFPASGSLSPKKLIDFYMRDIQILPHIYEKDISHFDHIVVGAAQHSSGFAGLEDIPLQSIRGHISIMSETPASSSLLTHLCYGGYLSPSYQGQHVLGSTFQAWMDTPEIQSTDHTYVIDKLHQATPPFFTAADIKGGRVSFRTAAPDRMPVIGSRIVDNRKVYISTAHGSHGIITSLSAARIIAQDISHIPISVPKSVLKAISPDRFAFQEKKSKVFVS